MADEKKIYEQKQETAIFQEIEKIISSMNSFLRSKEHLNSGIPPVTRITSQEFLFLYSIAQNKVILKKIDDIETLLIQQDLNA